MVDNMTRVQRSRTMSQIRSRRNATTEVAFLDLLRKRRISGWRRNTNLIGKPDLVFAKERVAVFLDGCFWHGCPRCRLQSRSHVRYWRVKITGNSLHDKSVSRELRSRGWIVIRVWEHDIKKQAAKSLRKLEHALVVGSQRRHAQRLSAGNQS